MWPGVMLPSLSSKRECKRSTCAEESSFKEAIAAAATESRVRRAAAYRARGSAGPAPLSVKSHAAGERLAPTHAASEPGWLSKGGLRQSSQAQMRTLSNPSSLLSRKISGIPQKFDHEDPFFCGFLKYWGKDCTELKPMGEAGDRKKKRTDAWPG